MGKAINLTIRFILELVILFALGYWGFHYDSEFIIQILLGLGLPLVAAILWGKIISPKATIKLPLLGVILTELLIFGAAFLCLLSDGFKVFAIIFLLVSFVNRFIILKFKQGIEL
ncbi:YrdB family protein [Paenibacillus aurantius]|uniref:YrdB family protein n=1 Tax=Paenibacillus aurantius TaxID=2918900 RepID=A0AA96LBD8_9BACL|nr:YrdB family protein [Paenibacillus aurantius]WNQ08822.1 YrdB family protein [Paenibacillus aurantius]